MKARFPIHWVSGESGIEGRIRWVQGESDPDFVIESEVVEKEGETTVYFLLRHGEEYIYRYLTGWFASDSYEEYRYTLRAAMHMAERFRYGEERSQYDAEHPWRTLINRLLWIERLSEEGFKLWVNNEYGPLKLKRDRGQTDRPIEVLERLFEGEVLKHYRTVNPAEDSA